MKAFGLIAVVAAFAVMSACGNDGLRNIPHHDAGPPIIEFFDAAMPVDAGPADAGPPDAGPPDAGPLDAGPPDAGGLENIDPICGENDGGIVFPAANMLPDTVPAACLIGFEMNDFRSTWTLSSKTDAGAAAITLEVDVATYSQPDIIRINAAEPPDGGEVTLLYTCDLRTSTYGDPTDGGTAPPQDSIREFRLPIPDGTTSLTFDFTGSHSPQYIRVLGLCDFDLTHPPAGLGNAWRLVTTR